MSETPEYFIPEFREAPKGDVKQGSGGLHRNWYDFAYWYRREADKCIKLYEKLIQQGVSPEQARFILPQGVLTEWVWTGSLLAFARFYNLRTDPHAQKEIQDLAKMVGEIIEPLYPVSWQALVGAKTSKPNNFNVGDTVIYHNHKYTILDVDLEKKLYKLDQHYYVGFTTIHKAMRPTMDRQAIKEVNDPINPNHYKTQSGVECIEVASLFPYSLGNAIKYAWRAGRKDNLKQDLKKCEWYLNRAMANDEIVFLKPHTRATRKAWLKLKKVLGELPERNAEILSNIIQGDLQGALSLLDDWITELD